MRAAGRIGAWAVVRDEAPRVFAASNREVLSRLLAVELVANTAPAELSSAVQLGHIRRALLEERWGDALASWIEETGIAVDVYGEPLSVVEEKDLGVEDALMRIRMAPIFLDPP